MQQQCDREGGTLARRAIDRDIAVHQLRQAAHDRQAEAGAAEPAGGGTVGLREGLEQVGLLRCVHADAGVTHR